MAETNCTHGSQCIECEKGRLADITAKAVQDIRDTIRDQNPELVEDESWNYDPALGDVIAGTVFEAVTKAAKFPRFDLDPLY